MTEPRRRIIWLNSIVLVTTPLAAAILLPIQLWKTGLHWSEPVALIALWMATGLGVTAGYHRLWSHRAWNTVAPIRFVLAVLGGAAWENSIIAWSADHRRHHRFTDSDEDPYNARRGFWWSHIGWAMVTSRAEADYSNVPDLQADPICRWQHRYYLLISTVYNIGVPLLLGLWTGRVLEMLLWGGLLRVVFVHHTTFFINSLAHMWGSRPWSVRDTSRDNTVLAFLTHGEGYHNYHHTFPSDYRNGVRWFHWDPAKWLIWGLERVSLAENLRRSPVDSLFEKRFETLKSRYEAYLEGAHEATHRRIAEAEERFRHAVERFRQARTEWAKRAEVTSAAAAHSMRAGLAEAHRDLVAAFELWNQTVRTLPIAA